MGRIIRSISVITRGIDAQQYIHSDVYQETVKVNNGWDNDAQQYIYSDVLYEETVGSCEQQ
jgi:hypothetical protein